MKPKENTLAIPSDYQEFLANLKARIRSTQIQAAVSVNQYLILLYWQIGQDILNRQKEQGWGAKVIDRLAKDLRAEFPEMKGFSTRNLKYMRAFAEAYPEKTFVQAAPAQITWYHNTTLLDKVSSPDERIWYIHKTIENGWSRDVLVHQIESGLYKRQGKAITNFNRTLPASQSELAQQLIKDPYIFDFLGIGEEARERELEGALLSQLSKFLLELGIGFAFVGRQYHLEVGGDDYYIDLLFYHVRLRFYIVIELKIGEFQPEYAGKVNFYLSAVDDLLRHPDDRPSIGLILCKARNRVVAEYSLRDMSKPIGVSEYRLTEALPEDLENNLPDIQALEAELEKVDVPAEEKN